MQDFQTFFKGKKVTVMGLGLLGRGVGDAAMLAEAGAHLTITDLKPWAELRPSLEKLQKYENIKYVLGKHDLADFKNCDMVLKAAGVPLDSIYLKEAKKNKIKVEMSATLFAKYSGIPMIGVTGTRGKSTVTHLIAHILKTAGKKVVLGGNVRGISNLSLLKTIRGNEVAVFELDSWQLQSFGENKMSPSVAVFTTFYPDHMVYYGKNMEKYFKDKANIFKYQKKGDVLVAGSQALRFIKKWGGKIKAKLAMPKLKKFNLKISGEHNLYNAGLAVEAVKALGVKDVAIEKALKTFKGVEGRLELVREVKGVKYYNDTTATTPEATIAALLALGSRSTKSIILIAGGFDKNLDMHVLLREIPKHAKKVILLKGTGTDRIKNKIKNHIEVSSMKEGVLKARSFAKKGDTVLMSPAFASFGMFENEYDRGDQFVKIVKGLK